MGPLYDYLVEKYAKKIDPYVKLGLNWILNRLALAAVFIQSFAVSEWFIAILGTELFYLLIFHFWGDEKDAGLYLFTLLTIPVLVLIIRITLNGQQSDSTNNKDQKKLTFKALFRFSAAIAFLLLLVMFVTIYEMNYLLFAICLISSIMALAFLVLAGGVTGLFVCAFIEKSKWDSGQMLMQGAIECSRLVRNDKLRLAVIKTLIFLSVAIIVNFIIKRL